MDRIVTIILLAAVVNCNEFISFYPYSELTTAEYKCFKTGGYDRISIWAESTPKGIEEQSIKNMVNAKNAGLEVEMYMTPCRARSAASQAQLIMKNMGNLFQTIWVYPQAADDACSWYEYPAEFNCMYLQQFVAQMKKNNKNVGIVGNRAYWIESFENAEGCSQVDDLNLLWVPSGAQIDRLPNFNSYRQIGGWKKPYAKLYSSKFLCGQTLSLVYYI